MLVNERRECMFLYFSNYIFIPKAKPGVSGRKKRKKLNKNYFLLQAAIPINIKLTGDIKHSKAHQPGYFIASKVFHSQIILKTPNAIIVTK